VCVCVCVCTCSPEHSRGQTWRHMPSHKDAHTFANRERFCVFVCLPLVKVNPSLQSDTRINRGRCPALCSVLCKSLQTRYPYTNIVFLIRDDSRACLGSGLQSGLFYPPQGKYVETKINKTADHCTSEPFISMFWIGWMFYRPTGIMCIWGLYFQGRSFLFCPQTF
jgi:hypothetical protein